MYMSSNVKVFIEHFDQLFNATLSFTCQFPITSAPQKTNQSGRDAWNKKLIVWYFEDQLKQRYESFVRELQVFSSLVEQFNKLPNVLICI